MDSIFVWVIIVVATGCVYISDVTKKMIKDDNPKIRLFGYSVAIVTTVAAVAVIVWLVIKFGPTIFD